MKVILREDVYKHGVAGEVVKVADGFARNWLIPKGMALPASKTNLEQFTTLREQAAENRSVYTDRVNTAARQIDGAELVFGVKAGSNNKLYGSITSQMIKDSLQEKTGLDINRRRISDRPIRELGRYDVPVRMGDVSPVLKIVVMREEEVAAYLGGKLAPEETAEALGEGTADAPSEAAEVAEVTEVTAEAEVAQAEPVAEQPAAESTGEAPADSGGGAD